MSQYLAENGIKSAKNFIAAPSGAMIAGGNRPSLTEARAETGDGFMGGGQLIQSNILLKIDFFDSLRNAPNPVRFSYILFLFSQLLF